MDVPFQSSLTAGCAALPICAKRARPRLLCHQAFIVTTLPNSIQRQTVPGGLCYTFHTSFLPQAARKTRAAPLPSRLRERPAIIAARNSEQVRENLTNVSESIIRAVESLSRQPRQTVADIAAAAGVSLTDAGDEAVKLASLTGASIDVTDGGDIAYRFPGNVRGALRSRSLLAALSMTWRRIAPSLFLVSRVAFGALLVISIVVTFLAIAALSASAQRDDDRPNNNRSSGFMMGNRLFGPNVFDVMFYSRPYGYYDYGGDRRGGGRQKKDGMSFLEAVYSFVFGDGDPNTTFDEQRWQAVGAVVRANRGAVTAEMLAPLLDPPKRSEYDTGVVDESFMLPALTRFQGHPEVTEDGDIIYVFPSFMTTGARGGAGAVEIVGQRTVSPLVEKEVKLTQASGQQTTMVIALGVVNVIGVAILGSQLVSAVPVTRDAMQLLGLLRSVYPVLFVYAASFFATPLIRYLRLGKWNEAIRARNKARADVASLVVRGGVELRRKMRAAEEYVVRGGNVNSDGVAYSSDRDAMDQRSVQEDLTDDFDRRLNG